MISAVAWVPHGATRRVPIKQELSAYEVAAVRRYAADESRGLEDDDDDDDDGDSRDSDELLDDPAFNSIRDVPLPAGFGGGRGRGGRQQASKTELAARAEIAQRETAIRAREVDAPAEFDDDDDEGEDAGEDADDLVARPGDAFILVANTEDEFSSLEVHCYNEDEGALYVHHDITLPAFPLCVEWMDYAGSGAAALAASQPGGAAGGASAVAAGASHVGSFAAVGTFKSDIEIWNLDVLDPLEPVLTLRGAGGAEALPPSVAAAAPEAPLSAAVSRGGGAASRAGKKAAQKAAAAAAAAASAESASAAAPSAAGGHRDAVMGLSWNRVHRHSEWAAAAAAPPPPLAPAARPPCPPSLFSARVVVRRPHCQGEGGRDARGRRHAAACGLPLPITPPRPSSPAPPPPPPPPSSDLGP